jgi:hypothetical protein
MRPRRMLRRGLYVSLIADTLSTDLNVPLLRDVIFCVGSQ